MLIIVVKGRFQADDLVPGEVVLREHAVLDQLLGHWPEPGGHFIEQKLLFLAMMVTVGISADEIDRSAEISRHQLPAVENLDTGLFHRAGQPQDLAMFGNHGFYGVHIELLSAMVLVARWSQNWRSCSTNRMVGLKVKTSASIWIRDRISM